MSQPAFEKRELAPDQAALVAAMAEMLERLLPKVPQIEAPKPEPKPTCISIKKAAEMHGVTVARMMRAGKAGKFFYMVDKGAKVLLSEMETLDLRCLLDLPKRKRPSARRKK